MKGERDEGGSNDKLCGGVEGSWATAGPLQGGGCYPPIRRSYLDNLPTLRTSRCLHWQATFSLHPVFRFISVTPLTHSWFRFFTSTLCISASDPDINYCESLCPKWPPHAKHWEIVKSVGVYSPASLACTSLFCLANLYLFFF